MYGADARPLQRHAIDELGSAIGAAVVHRDDLVVRVAQPVELLEGLDTPRTRLAMVRRRPVPFPPEPIRWAGIQLTRRSIARADAADGRRDLWLRTLDRLGLGFDS
jgi:hypothetical protein